MKGPEETKGQGEPRVAILVDRSRDMAAAEGLIGLEPDDRYHTTDNRLPLTSRTLAGHDVLVIAGHGPATYRRREMDAIVTFVRRGGGLLLAGAVGLFERYTAREAGEMAVCAVARRFGVELLSPREAAGKCGRDADLVAGYPPESVRIHRCGPMRRVRERWVHIGRWGPLRGPRQSTVLMSHRRTGEHAAIATRFGKGRIVVLGADFIGKNTDLCRRLVDHLATGRRRAGQVRRLPYEIAGPERTRRVGAIELRYAPAVARRLGAALRVVRKVEPVLNDLVPAKKPRTLRVELRPSCTSSTKLSSHRRFGANGHGNSWVGSHSL